MYNELLYKLNQFPKLERTLLILICRMCTEGIKVRSFFDVIEPLFPEKRPYEIQTGLDGLQLAGWIEVIGDEVMAIKEHKEIISGIEIEDDPMSGIMERLVELTTVAPCDELLRRIPYIRMGLEVLNYYQAKDCLDSRTHSDLYGRLAVNIAKVVGVTRGVGCGCSQFYDLPIYKILSYARLHAELGSTIYAQISLALSFIHTQVFEYEGASTYIEEARKIAAREGITDSQVQCSIAKSDMLLNQGLFGESLASLKLGWNTNILLHGDGCVENIEVVLKICNICLALRKKDTCKKWLSRITS